MGRSLGKGLDNGLCLRSGMSKGLTTGMGSGTREQRYALLFSPLSVHPVASPGWRLDADLSAWKPVGLKA